MARRVLGVAEAMALLLAGCGGSSNTGPGGSTGPPSGQKLIRLGVWTQWSEGATRLYAVFLRVDMSAEIICHKSRSGRICQALP